MESWVTRAKGVKQHKSPVDKVREPGSADMQAPYLEKEVCRIWRRSNTWLSHRGMAAGEFCLHQDFLFV